MNSRAKLILVTGGTGFVGRQVLQSLANHGVRVRVVVRPGSERRLPSTAVIDSTLTSADIFAEPPAWWAAACRGVDTVIHLAWYSEPGHYLQSPLNLDCLRGTLELARGAVHSGVRRFVGVGTCAEYDLSSGRVTVGTPLRPTTVYAATKAATFLTLSQWLPTQHTEFAWCRLFYLYGAGEDERRLVAYVRARLAAGEPAELTSGNQVRDFLEVGDAAGRIVNVALGSDQGAVNVCSGVPVTVRALAERIADEYGRRDLLRFGARPDNLLDPPMVVGDS